MDSKLFQLEILTPRHKVFSGQVASLVVPAAEGYLGVLANHAPIIAALQPGKIICRNEAGSTQVFQAAGSGFLEVDHNRATVLMDEAAEGVPG